MACVLPAAQYRRMPWKNGGGETAEIAVFPQGAGLGEFSWRISMATVASDGPFSRFPDTDRILAIVKGAGMTLSVAGMAPATLHPDSEPFAFPGDLPTEGRLVAGTIVDFNLMVRRGWTGDMRRGPFSTLIAPTHGVTIALALAPARLRLGPDALDLGQGDTLRLDAGEARPAILSDAPALIAYVGPTTT